MRILHSRKNLVALGFSPQQIECFQRLRALYKEKQYVELRRLEFARWLVATGRLTDEISAIPSREDGQRGEPLQG